MIAVYNIIDKYPILFIRGMLGKNIIKESSTWYKYQKLFLYNNIFNIEVLYVRVNHGFIVFSVMALKLVNISAGLEPVLSHSK